MPRNAHLYEAIKIESLAGTLVKPLGDNPNTNDSIHAEKLLAGQHGDVTKTSPRNSNNSISAAKLLKDIGMSYNSSEKILDANEKRNITIREYRVYHGDSVISNESDVELKTVYDSPAPPKENSTVSR